MKIIGSTRRFASVYPLYIDKAEKKGRTEKDVNEIICWLTGDSRKGFETQLEQDGKDFAGP